MLVLTRKEGQSVQLEVNGLMIVMKVFEVDGKVRIGFEAPPEVKIMRTEIVDRDR